MYILPGQPFATRTDAVLSMRQVLIAAVRWTMTIIDKKMSVERCTLHRIMIIKNTNASSTLSTLDETLKSENFNKDCRAERYHDRR